MNKSAKTTKVYAISLSLIFLANVLFLQGNNSVFSIGPTQSKGCADKTFDKYAGQRVSLTQNTTSPVNITFTQINGPNVLNGSNSVTGPVLIFHAPVTQSDLVIGFNASFNQGARDSTCTITYNIKGDQIPTADAGENLNIKLNSNICNQGFNSSSFLLPFNLIGSKSTDSEGPITYSWTQISGPHVELFNSDSSIANFRINICELEQSITLIFNLKVTDKIGQINNGQTKIILDLVNIPMSPKIEAPPPNEGHTNGQQIDNNSENKNESKPITTLTDILNTFHPIAPR